MEILSRQQNALLAFENFASAPVVSRLHGKNTGAGWENGWNVQSSREFIPGYNITDADPLLCHNLQSDPQYGTGGTGYNIKRKLDASFPDGPFADYLVGNRICAPGKTIWVSRIWRGGTTITPTAP